MNIKDFKRIVTSFADKPSDVTFNKGNLLTEVRGELIEAEVIEKDNVLFVIENQMEYSAVNWIKQRIAYLPQLAERIIDYIPHDNTFVNPSGVLLDELEVDPEEREQEINNTTEKLSEILSKRIVDASSVVYLTSDAGEGKTTLINQLAQLQAQKFKQGLTSWLLLPIPLGGRPFLRFDDIVVASIVNNLRFRYLYYDSFIELVRLGLIVPAFDGFEEMFMQSSTGEALTATSGLINKLDSSGAILIAARKAYFEYKSFGLQAKLFDSIKSSVSFARLEIHRWSKEQFIEYCDKQKVDDAENIFNLVSEKLNDKSHPILTRPVLVKQLIEVFKDIGNVNELINKLESVQNYFPTFVSAIIEREANHKWLDTSGETFRPILTVEQHFELLSLLAEEMWVNNSSGLKESIIDLIAEMFAEQNSFDVQTNRQIRERIKQHALLVRENPNNSEYRFDHEEFYEFFLGISIANAILKNKIQEAKSLLKKALLPLKAGEAVVSEIKKLRNYKTVLATLDLIVKGENQFSYVRENAGNLVIRILNNEKLFGIDIKNYELPINSLMGVELEDIQFMDCHFQSTSMVASKFVNCTFLRCLFDRIEINNSTTFDSVKMLECEISTAFDISEDKGFYDQFSIHQFLQKGKITVESSNFYESVSIKENIDDKDLEIVERALRRFMRSNTAINDGIFKLRLGNNANHFFDLILPNLLEKTILIEVDYLGSGQGRRFKLGVSFSKIDDALRNSNGSYCEFLSKF